MRIALIGEFSGFYKNLAIGLRRLGHEVDIFANGDGFKQISGAKRALYMKKEGRPIYNIWGVFVYPFFSVNEIKNYDIAQFVCPRSYFDWVNYPLMKKIIKNNKKVFFSIAGFSYALFEAYENGVYEYYMFDGMKRPFYRESILWNRRKEEKILRAIDGIIPVSYEYDITVRKYSNRREIVLLPLDVESVEYSENVIEDKIVIFHGLIREEAKGTEYIREAMNRIQAEYPDKVTCIIDGKMPQDEYLQLMNRTNVVVDQCKSYGYGMAALYAMAQGKAVLSGARYEALEYASITDCPILEARPDSNQIYGQLKFLVDNPEMIAELGRKGREFVEKHHDCDKIAKQYVDIWLS